MSKMIPSMPQLTKDFTKKPQLLLLVEHLLDLASINQQFLVARHLKLLVGSLTP